MTENSVQEHPPGTPFDAEIPPPEPNTVSLGELDSPDEHPEPEDDDDGEAGSRREQAQSRARVPKPPHFKFSSESRQPDQRPDAFFKWLSNLKPPVQQLLKLYVYRKWPVIRTMAQRRGKLEPTDQIAKLFGSDMAITDTDDVLHRWGSGDYRFLLNTSGKGGTTVAQCTIKGLREDAHPPVIEDLSTLVMDDPFNASYINNLRLKGVRLPGERAEEQEEEDVANVEAVRVLTSSLSGMADKVIQVSEKAAEARAKTDADQAAKDEKGEHRDPNSEAQLQGIGLVVKAGELCNTMIQNAAGQAQKLQGNMADPIALMTKTVELLKGLKASDAPAGDQTAVAMLLKRVDSLETALTAAQEARIKLIEGLLTKSTAAEQQPSALAGAGGKASLAAQVKELVEAFDALEELRGGGENLARAATGGKYGWIPGAIQGGLSLAGMISNIIYNARATGTPVPPTAPPVMQPELAAAMGEAMPPGAQPGGQPVDQVRNMLMQLQTPLLNSLQSGESGDEFADTLIRWAGRIAYDQLKGMGKDTIMGMLQSYPPIWSVVIQIPQRFEQYLDEFLRYDEIVAQGEEPPPLNPEVINPKRKKPAVS